MKKKIISGLLAATMMLSTAVPTFALAGDTKTSEITIDAKATTVNVTVPSSAPMVFNEDGTNTLPSNFDITNNSDIAGVHINSIKLDGTDTGWSVLKESADLKTQKKNLKKIKIKMGVSGNEKIVAPTNGSDDSTGTATFGPTDFAVAANETKKVNFVVERGAFTEPVANAKAYDMTIVFDFD